MMDEIVTRLLLERISKGDSPIDIATAAERHHVSKLDTIRFLRIQFSLGIAEAKEAIVQSQGHATLSDYEEKTIEPIMEALDAIESEDEDSTTD